jgi:hypothetical protein
VGSCDCRIPYQWDSVSFVCVLNCSKDPMNNDTGTPANSDECSCLGNGQWSTENFIC